QWLNAVFGRYGRQGKIGDGTRRLPRAGPPPARMEARQLVATARHKQTTHQIMKNSMTTQCSLRPRIVLVALFFIASLAISASPSAVAKGSGILPPGSRPYGKSYSEWSAAWWQWALSQPVTGHPFVDDPAFDVAAGQSGQVWFLGTPFGTV